jgi:Flp pilus assembly protein TadD
MGEQESRLSRVGYVSIAQATQRRIGDFALDPSIPLPIQLPPGQASWGTAELSWEAILAGVLDVLAEEGAGGNADYYRRFVLAVKPDIKDELTHLGIMKARDGEHDLAIEVFRSLEGLFPDCAVTKMNLALALDGKARRLEDQDMPAEAEHWQGLAFEAYKRALAADPSEPMIHYNTAFFYLHQRSFEKAREHLEVYARAGTEPSKVKEANRLIREIDSQGLVDGLFQKAYDFIRMGREQEGIEAVGRFLEVHPGAAKGWFLLGWGCRRLARYAEGRDAFLKALSLGAALPDLLNELAICLMELGDLEASAARLHEALRMEPENTKIISNLGIVALKQGRREEAMGFFRTVREFDPEDPLASRYLDEAGSPPAGAPADPAARHRPPGAPEK